MARIELKVHFSPFIFKCINGWPKNKKTREFFIIFHPKENIEITSITICFFLQICEVGEFHHCAYEDSAKFGYRSTILGLTQAFLGVKIQHFQGLHTGTEEKP